MVHAHSADSAPSSVQILIDRLMAEHTGTRHCNQIAAPEEINVVGCTDSTAEAVRSSCDGAPAGAISTAAACTSSSSLEPLPQGSSTVSASKREHNYSPTTFDDGAHVFMGEWDEEGVFFYQAFKDAIADWALEHQRFGGPEFNATRMTWIKPSFAWVLYRSGYGHKHNQNRILKVKLPHEAVGQLLSLCQCREGGGGAKGRVQWDPAWDLLLGDGKVPREMRSRAIQIGLKGSLSELYVHSVVSIQDVTALAHRVGQAHRCACACARAPRGGALNSEPVTVEDGTEWAWHQDPIMLVASDQIISA